MARRTEKQIKNAPSHDYVGDDSVAQKLKEIEIAPSSLETIDCAMMRFIDEELNL